MLNDAVKGFMLGEDPDRRTVFESPGISVSVPSARYLLAMKVYAARADRDADDIRTLERICELDSADAVLDLAEQYMAGIPVPAKVGARGGAVRPPSEGLGPEPGRERSGA